jgi:hypothetical protein
VDVLWLRDDDDAPALRLGDIMTHGPGIHIERQRAVCEPLDKLVPPRNTWDA